MLGPFGKMTIREVLNADWTIDRIEVNVRKDNAESYSKYIIGKDVEPTKYMRFIRETEAGSIYKDANAKVIVSNRIIQFRQLQNKPKGKEFCVGILEKEIPVEILNLTVYHMSPFGCGRSDDMHGYRFDCYVDFWSGISGENEQLSLDDYPEVMPE